MKKILTNLKTKNMFNFNQCVLTISKRRHTKIVFLVVRPERINFMRFFLFFSLSGWCSLTPSQFLQKSYSLNNRAKVPKFQRPWSSRGVGGLGLNGPDIKRRTFFAASLMRSENITSVLPCRPPQLLTIKTNNLLIFAHEIKES